MILKEFTLGRRVNGDILGGKGGFSRILDGIDSWDGVVGGEVVDECQVGSNAQTAGLTTRVLIFDFGPAFD